MALNVKSEQADRLARELAGTTGESLTDAITAALEERLRRERARHRRRGLAALIAELQALPVLDRRPADEILGYDDRGLPA